MITDVSVDLVTNEQFVRTVGGGGMKITIDGNRLNRYVDEDVREWSDWHPEYVGDDLASDLWRLVDTTTTVLEERSTFEEHVVDFQGLRSRLLLEHLGADAIRVAFRVAEPKHDAEDVLRATPESACGYPVASSAWGEAVLRAGGAFRDQLVELGHEDPGDEDGYGALLADLRRQLGEG